MNNINADAMAMINRTQPIVREASVRCHDFEEVSLGFNEEMALREASRCLNCKNPRCVGACPVNIQIPSFIALAKEGKIAEAALKIQEDSSLGAICGRVCPQENQCEGSCILGVKGESVAIGNLERFVSDWSHEHADAMEAACGNIKTIAPNGKKVAILGSGPSGLACASDLVKWGYDVTVFEALHEAGGVLVYGIPEFRLPKDKVVKPQIEELKSRGVKFETNVVVGRTVSIDSLMDEEGFQAVFVGTGAGLPMFMNIPGENLNGVFSANEFLTRCNLMKAYNPEYATPVFKASKVIVVGGGNVAMDAARTALRLGAEVHIVYRRTMAELPARREEVHHAEEEGIVFDLLCNPVEIIGNEKGFVSGVKCIRMELGEPDASGRRSPVAVPGSEFVVEADAVIMALGTSPNPLIANTAGLEKGRKGVIVADEHGATSRAGIFAGGDAVTGAATVILAMGAGRRAARAIDEYLRG